MSGTPVFRRRLTVTPEHIDELGHVSNLQYVRWILEVAEAHSAAVGYDLAAYRELGGVFMVSRQEIDYRDAALEGDELEVKTWVDSWRGASSIRATSIVRASDDKELCRARTRWVYVSIARNRAQRIPVQLIERFSTVAPIAVA